MFAFDFYYDMQREKIQCQIYNVISDNHRTLFVCFNILILDVYSVKTKRSQKHILTTKHQTDDQINLH